MKYYPVFLDLHDRWVLVVGGGPVAERKVIQLLESGARIRVVSPELTPALIRLAQAGRIAHRRDKFNETDLDDVCLAIAATDDGWANNHVARAAEQRNLFCNVVDVPSLCSFLAPAIVARGDVQIAISTSGGSPALAQRLKREIAAQVGQEYAELAELMSRWRSQLREKIPDQQHRAELFHRLVESDILDLLRAGRRSEAQHRASQLMNQATKRRGMKAQAKKTVRQEA